MFWKTYLRQIKDASTGLRMWYFEMRQFDWDGDLSDIDEPACSQGMEFPDVETAGKFAARYGFTFELE